MVFRQWDSPAPLLIPLQCPEGEQDPTPPSYLPRSTEASRGRDGWTRKGGAGELDLHEEYSEVRPRSLAGASPLARPYSVT